MDPTTIHHHRVLTVSMAQALYCTSILTISQNQNHTCDIQMGVSCNKSGLIEIKAHDEKTELEVEPPLQCGPAHNYKDTKQEPMLTNGLLIRTSVERGQLDNNKNHSNPSPPSWGFALEMSIPGHNGLL